MRTIPLSQLKARLSEQIRLVKHGEHILVTDRGRPVAELRPVTGEVGPEALEDLVRTGLVRRGHGDVDRVLALPRSSDPEGRVLQALLAERREGR